MHLGAEWIETAAAIDQQKDGEWQTVLAEVGDLLLRSVFVKNKIFLFQSTHHARGGFLKHQRVDRDQIDINLDDFFSWARRNYPRIIRVGLSGRVRAYPSVPRLRHDLQRKEEENE